MFNMRLHSGWYITRMWFVVLNVLMAEHSCIKAEILFMLSVYPFNRLEVVTAGRHIVHHRPTLCEKRSQPSQSDVCVFSLCPNEKIIFGQEKVGESVWIPSVTHIPSSRHPPPTPVTASLVYLSTKPALLQLKSRSSVFVLSVSYLSIFFKTLSDHNFAKLIVF